MKLQPPNDIGQYMGSLAEVAAHYGVSKSTVTRWRKQAGIRAPHGKRGPSIDYPRMDDMIRANMKGKAICAALGCHPASVSARKRRLGLSRPGQPVTQHVPLPTMPMIDMAEREREKARQLGMKMKDFRRIWLPCHVWTPDGGYADKREWRIRCQQ
jgi:hypothetical protein